MYRCIYAYVYVRVSLSLSIYIYIYMYIYIYIYMYQGLSVAYAMLIKGYAQRKECAKALALYDQMQETWGKTINTNYTKQI